MCAIQIFTQIKPAVYDLWLIGTAYYWQNPGQISSPPTPYPTHSSKTDSLFEKTPEIILRGQYECIVRTSLVGTCVLSCIFNHT